MGTLLVFAALGCRSAPTRPSVVIEHPSPPGPSATAEQGTRRNPLESAPVIATVAFNQPLPIFSGGPVEPIELGVAGDALSREWLVAEVEARNPSLEAMIAAWQAAAQRYPQQIALDDPMLMGMIAPESAGSDVTETAYALQLNQKLPWFGKRRLRGASAAAEADAAFHESEDTRLQVRLTAELAFFEYFLSTKLIAVNRENTRIMQQFRETAQERYRNNQVTQQDLLQADLELADLARRLLELNRMQQVSIARINTLLRRWPDAPLPPPADLDVPQRTADTDLLWQTAIQQRPDLSALAWRVQAEEAALGLAYKNFYPDFDVFGRYDTFWQPSSTQGPLRAQVGASVNLPIYREKLRAAVCEAQFRLAQRRAEFEQRMREVQYEVISAAKQVEESQQTIELYAQRLVPTAEQNVAAVSSNYIVAKSTFLDLAQARRQLVMMYERQLEAVVSYHRRISELNRAVGVGYVGAAASPATMPSVHGAAAIPYEPY